jgi:hypothetical protein
MRLANSLVLVFLLSCPSLASALPYQEAVSVVDAKSANVFVYKGSRKMIGAIVEVYTTEGVLMTKQILKKRRMHIDFGKVKSGEYTIRISKGEKLREYQFVKKL